MMSGQAKEQVIALRPVYTDIGDVTEVYYEGGGLEIRNRSVKSEVRIMAKSFAVDLKAQREMVGEMVNRKALVPLLLGEQVFVPFKMRRPRATNDYSYGYVDVLHIEEILEDDKRCRVRLKDGRELPVMTGREVALSSYADGMRLVRLQKRQEVRRRARYEMMFRLAEAAVEVVEMISDIHRLLAQGDGSLVSA